MAVAKKERPKILTSITERVKTGCGFLYVTIGHEDGTPIEIFAALGKAGGCSHCQNEALSRSISLGLKYGVPVMEYVKELTGNACPSVNMWPEDERVLSCADGLGKVLKRFHESHNENNQT